MCSKRGTSDLDGTNGNVDEEREREELRTEVHSIQRKCSFYEVVKTFLPKSLGQRKYSEKAGEKERICSALRTIVDQQKMYW